MAYAYREVNCSVCNRLMRGRYKPNGPWLCFECSRTKMIAHITQQADRSSDLYRRNKRIGELLKLLHKLSDEQIDRLFVSVGAERMGGVPL